MVKWLVVGEWCQREGIEKVKRRPRRTEYRYTALSKDHWSDCIGTKSKKVKETKA